MKKKETVLEAKPVCEHVEECQKSNVVLFYLDACADCDIAPKFKK